jgi:hypothetical protein
LGAALLCVVCIFAAGCHRNNLTSGYGIVWVTVTDTPGDFAAYRVNLNSMTLTRNDGAVVTALATVETVDFAKLGNYSELWGSATVPVGTYTSASIVLDYTNADIVVMENGVPVQATPTGTAPTTITVLVTFDPANPLVVAPTYATTAAQRLALDVNLAASTQFVDLSTNPAQIQVRPYITAAIAPPDNKPVRIRGPLINSNVGLGTYSVYVRPFYDEADNLGSLSIFTTPQTLFTIDGSPYQGNAGVTQLSQSSAGSTVTAAYTTYKPTATPSATAGIFTALYVIAGSSLEDVYTQGLEGDVIARNGDTLTLLGSTLFLNDGVTSYNLSTAQVLLGPDTIVTADDTALTGLNSQSVAVGQHVIVRGICTTGTSCGFSGSTVTLDATGNTATNTGSVRLISTHLWGSLVSSSSGNLVMDLQSINDWPLSDFTFSGNGTAPAPNPSSFSIGTGDLTVPDTTPGSALWVSGRTAPFGSAAPDFTATAVNDELSVQTAGSSAASPTPLSCGQANFDCTPASMRLLWTGVGTTTPFSVLSTASMTVNLANPSLYSAVIRIGPEAIDMKTLPVNPQILPTPAPAPVTTTAGTPGAETVTLPPLFLPSYSYGNPSSLSLPGIQVFSAYSTFASDLNTALASAPALGFEARGTYNRSTNTFNAISIDVVLD